jgi:molybdopterin-containing oxidoreductase family iron-sulfur binding subunit
MSHRRPPDDSEPSCKGEGRSSKLVRIGARRTPDRVADAGDATRRDFLSLVGFSVAAAGLTACRAPEQKAIPLPIAPEDMVPGVARRYATTCGGCASACSLLVTQRDGRPIKVEGNDASALFGGATCAAGQATVLSLYDGERVRGPLWQGRPASWEEIDARVRTGLDAARDRVIVLLSSTLTSPSLREIVARWGRGFSGFRHVVHDAVSASALRAATAGASGRAVVPHLAFDRARVIVALDADFLGTWLSPVEFARQYASGRSPERPDARSFHVQFEAGLSVTGSNADLRIPVAPSRLGAVAAGLLARIASRAQLPDIPHVSDPIDPAQLDRVADELWEHRGESLVVSGRNDVAVQQVVHALNTLLGNLGRTVDLARPSLQRQGDDQAMAELIDQMNRGQVGALIMHGVNPAHDWAEPGRFMDGLARVPLSVSTADRVDETAAGVHALCPDHHFLESWGDAEPVDSLYGLSQPTIAPLFDTRSAGESLLRWIGDASTHYSFVRSFWRDHVFPRQGATTDFESFWDHSLERGFVDLGVSAEQAPASPDAAWRDALRTLDEEHRQARDRGPDRYELSLFESVALRDGRHANNPWLQELPDPITKVSWGNVAAVSAQLAGELGLAEGDVVSLATESARIELPVFVQPGQEARTISVALGHGRTRAGKAGSRVGANAFPLARMVRGARAYWAGVTVDRTGRREAIAGTQSHFSMEGRDIALETTLAELARGGRAAPAPEHDLWSERPPGEHTWAMAIDLDSCTGCSACVVACQAENNVPVVGKDQVQRQRIMHWIRIDRYYSGPADQPRSMHQPMMCQHCGHAPCETVCPVLATTRSAEGLNQQVYNRCVGTRYCANNCPYKVRRFNWFNYTDNPRFDFHMTDPVGRMVLNPDVTVRSRGVMEKCSLCVQRIQSAKNGAAATGRPLADGDIVTACQQACPTRAIVFGDVQDPNSRVSRLMRGARTYRVLEELGTRPGVAYLKRVRRG